jgi:hypothetical protein
MMMMIIIIIIIVMMMMMMVMKIDVLTSNDPIIGDDVSLFVSSPIGFVVFWWLYALLLRSDFTRRLYLTKRC